MGAGLSGSLSCCHILCVLSRLFLRLQYTHFLIFSSCLRLLCSGGTPERVFFNFCWKGFRTRACTDIQCTFAQKCFFLQRQKSVFKSSYRVRGMGPPQGSAFACAVTTVNKTKKQKLKKIQVLLRTVTSNKHFAFSQRAPNCSIVVAVLNKTCVFFSFCFFGLFIVVAVHAKAGP